VTTPKLDRRRFIASATTLAGASLAVGAETSATEVAAPRFRAAVLEFGDRWTKQSIGLARLLQANSIDVEPLDTTRPPSQDNGLRLIAFGSFTNNDRAYLDYVDKYRQQLGEFVRGGGVVLEMTQSDQFGRSVDYLPPPLSAIRGDRDLSSVFKLAPLHPLVKSWMPGDAEMVGAEFFGRATPNWESFEAWNAMRVLLASDPAGRLPCLLEGEHGKGRFVVSSLYLDKCYNEGGELAYGERAEQIGQAFFAAVADYVELVTAGRAEKVVATPVPPVPSTGPMVGHVDDKLARIWFRPGSDGPDLSVWRLTLSENGTDVATVEATAEPDHDNTMVFDVAVASGTEYEFTIAPADPSTTEHSSVSGRFRSAPAPEAPYRVTLGMGSCAPSDPNYVWQRVIDEGCEGFVFLGDTPYIDSSDLAVVRDKHRQFLSQPEIARMIATMPCWGTWDDHDFGKNDGHGDFPGKHVCRTGFTEYRANATFGHDRQGQPQTDRFGEARGIYTSFRRGALEVFLLDPRWFSRTEKSWADPSQPTCLGKLQWEWFREQLLASRATFKAITTGMIWDDKQNSEKDDWHTYRHEREAIFDFIRNHKIGGCFLIGGDIHVSRALNYGPRVGYDLWQFIISPLHAGIIPALDVPHPNLVHHALEPYVFLKLEADTRSAPATLHATWINRDGRRIFDVALTETDLTPPEA
jgi:phosphodiesterase/alkaline phosphatase D-like protein